MSAFAQLVVNNWDLSKDPRDEMDYERPYPTTGPAYCTACSGPERVYRYDLWVIKKVAKGQPKGRLHLKCPHHLDRWFTWSRENAPERLTPQVLAIEWMVHTWWARIAKETKRSEVEQITELLQPVHR